jgi:hypothetical protein
MTLGPKKIPFNLLVKSSNKTLTATGALWIVGNLDVTTQPTIKMAASLGSSNVPIIVDNTSNRSTSSIVTLNNGASFQGSGSANSFVFIISMNNSAENGGSVTAISPGQSSNALVIYASHGYIDMSNTVNVADIVAYKVNMSQSAKVSYDPNLANLTFANGTSASFSIIDWGEGQ